MRSSRSRCLARFLATALLASPLRAQEERVGTLALADAATAFADLRAACARDAGGLWGRDVCAPVLLVDPATRRVVASQADAEGRLEPRGAVFVGALPPDRPLANAPIEWAGVRWAMALVPFLGATREERLALLAHESFHCLQKELGLYVMGEENAHLAETEGRITLQLEWRALLAALRAEGEARRAATADALDFRAARRARFPEAAERENALELREGLANYTGQRLAGRSAAEVAAYCAERIAREETFNRSFAYWSGPLYGYLLDEATPGWRARLSATSDLGSALARALELAPSPERAATRAALYDGEALRAREEARAREREAQKAEWQRTLVDGPVLILDLSAVKTGTMDTRRTFPFAPDRLVYTKRDLAARFGTLALDGAAILEDASTHLGRISLQDAAADHLSGPGWRLELAAGWKVEPGERAGDFVVRPDG